jgi:hypothetical protein
MCMFHKSLKWHDGVSHKCHISFKRIDMFQFRFNRLDGMSHISHFHINWYRICMFHKIFKQKEGVSQVAHGIFQIFHLDENVSH